MNANVNILISGFSSPERITLSAEGTGLSEIRETIANATEDFTLSLSANYEKIQFLYINSTRAVTISSFAGETVQDQVSITANNPIIYRKSPAFGENPFLSNFDYCEITNTSGGSAQVTILMLVDATPDA
jgi:hypothetical protein